MWRHRAPHSADVCGQQALARHKVDSTVYVPLSWQLSLVVSLRNLRLIPCIRMRSVEAAAQQLRSSCAATWNQCLGVTTAPKGQR